MFTSKGNEALGQSYKADPQCSLIDNALYRFIGFEVFTTDPQHRHQQRKLFGQRRFLEIITVFQLTSGNFKNLIEFGKKGIDPVVPIFYRHALYGKPYQIDGGKREIAPTDRGLFTETIFKNAGTASHCGNLVFIPFGIIFPPQLVPVERCIEIDEIRKKATSGYFAGIPIQIVITIGGQITYPSFLFPYLYGEYGRRAVPYSLISAYQYLTDYTTSFGRSIRSIIDRTENDLIPPSGMYGIHIVNKRLHRLMYTAYRAIDRLLLDSFFACQSVEFLIEIIIDRCLIKMRIICVHKFFNDLYLLDIAQSHIRSKIEIKCGNGLSSVHFVLSRLHRDTAQDTRGFYAFGRTRLPMSGTKPLFQYLVERVLYTRQTLGRIVIFIMDMNVSMTYGVSYFITQQIIIDKRFCRLAGEFHHHAGRSIGIHIGIFPSDVVGLGIDDIEKHLSRLGLTGNATLIPISDILLCDFLTRTFHQFHFDPILNFLHRHLFTAIASNAVGYFTDQRFVFSLFGMEHRFADSRHDFFFVEADNTAITFDNSLYHTTYIKNLQTIRMQRGKDREAYMTKGLSVVLLSTRSIFTTHKRQVF